MSSAGSVPSAVGNGAPYIGRHQTSHPTPADMVGNQFVSQFYTVLHSSPRYLHRFYTDDSTVTHADCGIDGEPPTSQTVTTQKGISDRVLAMGFEEAVTEIWSVDSQYSQNNGVTVMVTGSLQCKGKKKRDFVQSFFLAVQEKGYFVLNDTFRYLSDRSSRPHQYPKENGYIPHDYNKGYNSQMGSYQQAQHAYYPGQLPGQATAHTAAVSNAYSAHVPQVAYPVPAPVPPVSATPQRDISRGHAVTPSMPQRDHAAATAPPKATAPPPAAPVQQQQQQASSAPHPAVPQPQAPVAHAAPPPQVSAPNTAPSASTAAVPQQTTQEVPKQAEPSTTAATPQKTEAPAASEAPVQPAPQAKPIAKPVAKPEPKESKSEPAPKPEEPPKPAEPAAPAVPLTYAERLKLGARSAPSKPAPAKPSSAPPTKPQQALVQQAAAAKAEESVVESNGSSEAPHAAQPPAETVSATPEENVTTSIFVRDFPEGVTPEKLEAAFSRFGPIRGGVQGINLRQQKGKEDYAFVEFEELAAMQASIEGQVIIDGKTVTVVERRPTFPRNLRGAGYQRREGGRGDGRGFRGGPARGERGRGGRGEGARPYTGGRGDGRGEGRGGGRGRSFESFQGDSRGEGGRGGRGDGGRGRGPGGRHPRGAPQSAPPTRPQQA